MATVHELPHKPVVLRRPTVVQSKWRTSRMRLDGSLPPFEWDGAGDLAIPNGHLLVQNNAETLYLALDLTDDFADDKQGDYFQLYIDVDQNGQPTAYHDLCFMPDDNNPAILACWRVTGPATIDYAHPVPIKSRLARGFGPSPHMRFPHRIWEVAIELSDLGLTLQPLAPPVTIKFGLHVQSRNPAFYSDVPDNAPKNFAGFDTIILAMHTVAYPGVVAGPVIGGIGLVPETAIAANGLATFSDLALDNSAFGGVLSFMQNVETVHALITQGAKTFAIRHRAGLDENALNAETWAPFRTGWNNYRWNGKTYVLESFGPDAAGRYPLIDPNIEYWIKPLLFIWNTTDAPNVLHQFELDFFDGGGHPISTKTIPLTLRIDNRVPVVDLLTVEHAGQTVQACDIVDMTSKDDTISVTFQAYDGEGLLSSYSVYARYGNDQTVPIANDTYGAHHAAPFWTGETAKPGTLQPPHTCAYDIIVAAYGRVTNGYQSTLQQVEKHRSVTLRVPPGGPIFIPKKITLPKPPGFSKEGLLLKS